MKKLYAKKGEVCTCTNGHHVFKFKRDVYLRDRINMDIFKFFNNQKEPLKGTPFEDCLCFCGANYVRSPMNEIGIELLIENKGWK